MDIYIYTSIYAEREMENGQLTPVGSLEKTEKKNYKHCSDDTLSSGVLSIFAKTTVLHCTTTKKRERVNQWKMSNTLDRVSNSHIAKVFL